MPNGSRTRQVVGQFLPSLIAGAIISASFVRLSPTLVPLLPGLWAICFGIGIFASRPYLAARKRMGRALLLRGRCAAPLDGARNRTAARMVGGRNLRRRATARRLRACSGTWNGQPVTAIRDLELEENDDWEEEV